MSKYIAGQRLRGVDEFPLVIMLEPLHACNLTCTGCGRIREYADTTDAHHPTFKDVIEKTPWEKYGHGRDPRCADCMVHAGYEPSAVLGANRRLGDSWKLLKWQLSSPAKLRPRSVTA